MVNIKSLKESINEILKDDLEETTGFPVELTWADAFATSDEAQQAAAEEGIKAIAAAGGIITKFQMRGPSGGFPDIYFTVRGRNHFIKIIKDSGYAEDDAIIRDIVEPFDEDFEDNPAWLKF